MAIPIESGKISVQVGDVDGDGKQDLTIITGNTTKAITVYDVKKLSIDVVEMIITVLVATGLLTVI